MTNDPAIATKLQELLKAIEGYSDPRRAGDEWKQVSKLLQKTDLPAGRITGIVGMRDVAVLRSTIDQLGSALPPPAAADVPDAETCKKALQVFRKRLSLMVLDEESRLGRSPLTKGSAASSSAITAPTEFPLEVWQELVRQGKLRYIGHGFYELVKQ